MSTNQETDEQMVSISTSTIEAVINLIRWNMYDSWGRATTMYSEEEYNKQWHRYELELIDTLQASIAAGQED